MGPPLDERTCLSRLLLESALGGREDAVRAALAQGADISSTNDTNWTACHLAAYEGHASVLDVLLNQHADVNAVTTSGATPLHLAATEGHEPLPDLLVSHHADINATTKSSATPLHFAAENGHVSVVLTLLLRNANVNAPTNYLARPLSFAAMNGHADVVEMLLSHHADIDSCDSDNESALHCAAARGHSDVVAILLEYGADTNIVRVRTLLAVETDRQTDRQTERERESLRIKYSPPCHRAQSSEAWHSHDDAHVLLVQKETWIYAEGTAAQVASTQAIQHMILSGGYRWSIARHRHAPKYIKRVVTLLMTIRSREPMSLLGLLPNEALFHIFTML